MIQDKLVLISINSLQTLPPVKQFYDHFKNKFHTTVIQCTLDDFENSFSDADHNSLINFKDNVSFLRQTYKDKLIKYFNLLVSFFKLVEFKNNKKQNVVLIVNELFPLLLCMLLKKRNQVIIYHQFEMVKPEFISKIDQLYLKIIKYNINKLDLIIIPEINRINYFKNIIKTKEKTNYFLLPNTNSNLINDNNNQRKEKVVVAHIGSIGEDSFIKELLDAFKFLNKENYELWIIGSLIPSVIGLIKSYNLSNIILMGQLKHSELNAKYKDIDIGLILYRGMEPNTLYCAPNKLYEFWSYGIPVIGHILPGLEGVFDKDFMGRVIDMSDPATITNTIKLISHKSENEKLANYFQENLRAELYYKKLEKILYSKFSF